VQRWSEVGGGTRVCRPVRRAPEPTVRSACSSTSAAGARDPLPSPARGCSLITTRPFRQTQIVVLLPAPGSRERGGQPLTAGCAVPASAEVDVLELLTGIGRGDNVQREVELSVSNRWGRMRSDLEALCGPATHRRPTGSASRSTAWGRRRSNGGVSSGRRSGCRSAWGAEDGELVGDLQALALEPEQRRRAATGPARSA
jgi:hypothetical protein